jgi:hypothetical protein
MNDGNNIAFNAMLEGDVWTVEMSRDLISDHAMDLNFESGKTYNFGFAIHDDYTNGRFHHVALGYKLFFNNKEDD